MREKEKEGSAGASGGGSMFDSLPGVPANKTVSVSSGPYVEDLPVAGMSVGEVRQKYSDRFDIDSQSQAVINGHPVKDDVILKASECLQFIRHAGEKGGARVIAEGKNMKFTSPEGMDYSMPIAKLADRMGQSISTGNVILPFGIKAVLSRGPVTVWVWERPPHIAKLSWIREDSPMPYGRGTTYRDVRIALPYLIILAVFARDNTGLPRLMMKDECFFRSAPLKSVHDKLHYPGLLNCSRFNRARERSPLSWICTQYLKSNPEMQSDDPATRFLGGFEAVRYCLLETSFNLSSEHHEGNSWYGVSKSLDARISTIERWEKATAKDPLFVLDVPWIDTEHTLEQVVNRIFNNNQVPDSRIQSADDLARIISQGES